MMGELSRLFTEMQYHLRSSDYRKIDDMFLSADVQSLSPVILVSMLKYTLSAHRQLSGWAAFYDRVRNEFVRRRLDAETIFSGLEAARAEHLKAEVST